MWTIQFESKKRIGETVADRFDSEAEARRVFQIMRAGLCYRNLRLTRPDGSEG